MIDLRGRRAGLTLGVLAAAWAASSCKSAPPASELIQDRHEASLQERLKAYGPAGVVWVEPRGVFASGPRGQQRARLSAHSASWCSLDHDLGVLWMWREHDGALALWAWDTQTPGATPAQISSEVEGLGYGLIVAYPGHPGAPDPSTYDVMLRLELGPQQPARLSAALGCQGDMNVYCVEHDPDAGPEGSDKLNEEVQDKLTRAAQVQLRQPELLERLRRRALARGASPAAASEPAAAQPATRRVAVDRSRCQEAPEDCGLAYELPKSDLWAVLVGNERGDFYHERWHLYDPRAARWRDAQLGRATSSPVESAEFRAVELSADGAWYRQPDRVVSLKGEPPRLMSEGLICGFTWPGLALPARLRLE